MYISRIIRVFALFVERGKKFIDAEQGKMNRQSALEGVLFEAKERFGILEDIPFESITDEMKLFVCKNVKQKCKQNVVGALYADLGGLFYSFSKTGEWI